MYVYTSAATPFSDAATPSVALKVASEGEGEADLSPDVISIVDQKAADDAEHVVLLRCAPRSYIYTHIYIYIYIYMP